MRKVVFSSVAVFVVAYIAYAALLFTFQDKLLFPGAQIAAPTNTPDANVARLVDLAFDGGRSIAFLLEPKHRTSPKTGALIIAHGNGEIADMLVDGFSRWRNFGVPLLIVEYPGYGRAPGTPSEESMRKAMVAAFDWLASQPDIDAKRIAAHGISLGGGAVGLLMRERPLAGVMLHSTFTALDAFPARYGLPAFLLRNHMNTLEAVALSNTPTVVIHGRNDTTIPPEHGLALAKAAKMTDFNLWDCGHGCFQDGGKPLYDATHAFLKRVGAIQ